MKIASLILASVVAGVATAATSSTQSHGVDAVLSASRSCNQTRLAARDRCAKGYFRKSNPLMRNGPQYSSNWAGAVLVGASYTQVTGTITVPTPKTPLGGSRST